jgi:deaminated glutathione amidase
VQMTSGQDLGRNLQQARELIASAAAHGARLIVLPENFALFGVNDRQRMAAAEADGDGPAQDFLAAAARSHRVWLVGGTIALRAADGRAHAASLLYDPEGRVAGRYDKIHLFDVDIPGSSAEQYRESNATAPGTEVHCFATEVGRVGIVVCYDIRFPGLAHRLGAMGVDLVAVPAAFTVPTGEAHWEVLLRARAIESLAYVVAAAQWGQHEGGRRTYGHSMIVDPWGVVLGRLERGAGIVSADIDMMRLRSLRESFPALHHRQEL